MSESKELKFKISEDVKNETTNFNKKKSKKKLARISKIAGNVSVWAKNKAKTTKKCRQPKRLHVFSEGYNGKRHSIFGNVLNEVKDYTWPFLLGSHNYILIRSDVHEDFFKYSEVTRQTELFEQAKILLAALSKRKAQDSEFYLKPTKTLQESLLHQFFISPEEALYTSLKSLLQRDTLRFDPRFHGFVSNLWRALDLKKTGSIGLKEYKVLYKKICLIFYGKRFEGNTRTNVLSFCASDWKEDAKDRDFLTRNDFIPVFFFLIDRFCTRVLVNLSLGLVEEVVNHVVKTNSDGRTVLQEDALILANRSVLSADENGSTFSKTLHSSGLLKDKSLELSMTKEYTADKGGPSGQGRQSIVIASTRSLDTTSLGIIKEAETDPHCIFLEKDKLLQVPGMSMRKTDYALLRLPATTPLVQYKSKKPGEKNEKAFSKSNLNIGLCNPACLAKTTPTNSNTANQVQQLKIFFWNIHKSRQSHYLPKDSGHGTKKPTLEIKLPSEANRRASVYPSTKEAPHQAGPSQLGAWLVRDPPIDKKLLKHVLRTKSILSQSSQNIPRHSKPDIVYKRPTKTKPVWSASDSAALPFASPACADLVHTPLIVDAKTKESQLLMAHRGRRAVVPSEMEPLKSGPLTPAAGSPSAQEEKHLQDVPFFSLSDSKCPELQDTFSPPPQTKPQLRFRNTSFESTLMLSGRSLVVKMPTPISESFVLSPAASEVKMLPTPNTGPKVCAERKIQTLTEATAESRKKFNSLLVPDMPDDITFDRLEECQRGESLMIPPLPNTTIEEAAYSSTPTRKLSTPARKVLSPFQHDKRKANQNGTSQKQRYSFLHPQTRNSKSQEKFRAAKSAGRLYNDSQPPTADTVLQPQSLQQLTLSITPATTSNMLSHVLDQPQTHKHSFARNPATTNRVCVMDQSKSDSHLHKHEPTATRHAHVLDQLKNELFDTSQSRGQSEREESYCHLDALSQTEDSNPTALSHRRYSSDEKSLTPVHLKQGPLNDFNLDSLSLPAENRSSCTLDTGFPTIEHQNNNTPFPSISPQGAMRVFFTSQQEVGQVQSSSSLTAVAQHDKNWSLLTKPKVTFNMESMSSEKVPCIADMEKLNSERFLQMHQPYGARKPLQIPKCTVNMTANSALEDSGKKGESDPDDSRDFVMLFRPLRKSLSQSSSSFSADRSNAKVRLTSSQGLLQSEYLTAAPKTQARPRSAHIAPGLGFVLAPSSVKMRPRSAQALERPTAFSSQHSRSRPVQRTYDHTLPVHTTSASAKENIMSSTKSQLNHEETEVIGYSPATKLSVPQRQAKSRK